MAVTHKRTSQAALLSVAISMLAGLAMVAALESHQTGQVTVFWGRHKDEGSLREACDSGMYTHIIMSFLNTNGHGVYHLDLSGHQLGAIGEDIKHCQLVGILVSLSVRGNNHSSLPNNNQSALDLVDYLWNAFLGGHRKDVHRPFGDAKLDGVDLFLERGTPAKAYHDNDMLPAKLSSMGKGNGKPIHVTATVPCSFMSHPDRSVLTKGIYESIHIRFFDDEDGNSDCKAYSEEVWDRWTAAYSSSKIFLGLPASPEAAKQGYLYPKSLYYGVLPVVQKTANYGGVMLWDRYYDKSANYSSYVKRWA